jgi:hypothetical protein
MLSKQEPADQATSGGAAANAAVPGKHTQVEALSGGGGDALPAPTRAKMESSFGADFSSVRVHQGPEADAIGARAFTHGSDIHFGAGEYQPGARGGDELLGHELAHVVQQSQGRVEATAQAKGLPVNDDGGLEHEADVAGAAAARGERVSMGGGGGGATGAIQGKALQLAAKATHYGTFTDEKYDLGAQKLDITLKFTPNDKVEASKIGLTQSLRTYAGGSNFQIDPTTTARTSGTGHFIDRISERNNPIYGGGQLGGSEGLKDNAQDNNKTSNATELNPDKGRNATFQLGHRIKQGEAWDVKDAGLYDGPTLEGGNNAGKEFETAAVGLEGNMAGQYLGSVKWGWKRDGGGTIAKIDFDVVSMGVPSKDFLGAAQAWNDGKARGNLTPRANGTKVVDGALAEKFTIDTGVDLAQKSTVMLGGKIYQFIEIKSDGANKGKTGYVESALLKDKGDGPETVDLPTVQVKLLKEEAKLYEDADLSKLIKSLPKGTRLKKRAIKGILADVEVVDGPDTGKTGWVASTKLSDE